MQLEDHPDSDGRQVWMNEQEADQFMQAADGPEQRIAFGLGVRAGLRSQEIVGVAPRDLSNGPAGSFIGVEHAKGDKYRETPVPDSLATTIRTVADMRDETTGAPLVDVTTRTLQRWVRGAAEELAAETGEKRWTYLTPHDLRKTWGHLLVAQFEVEPGLVMQWGGWSDWETFREHYLGRYSAKQMRQGREKVSWL